MNDHKERPIISFRVKHKKSILSIYEITKQALFTQVLMDENESGKTMICEKCMIMWENYYEYLTKHFDNIIPRWVLENNHDSQVLSNYSKYSI
jgi:hypothetical protein